MKKMKKSGWIAAVVVAVALITTVALIIGCRPVVGSSEEPGVPGIIQASFGYGGNGSRTVLPYDADITAFKIFYLKFSAGGTDTDIYLDIEDFENFPTYDPGVSPVPFDMGKSGKFPMKAGQYTLLITGYVDGSVDYDTTVPGAKFGKTGTVAIANAAGWWAGPVKVTGSDTQTIGAPGDDNPPIFLKGDTDTAGTGKFLYDIKNSTTGVIKQASITPVPGTAIPLTPLDALVWTNAATPLTLDTGFYYLDFVFEREGSNPIYFRHVMHIYQNLTSKFIYELTDDYFYIQEVLVDIYLKFAPPTDEEFAPIITATGLKKPNTFDPPYDVVFDVIEMTGGNVTFTVSAPGAVTYDTINWYCDYFSPTPAPGGKVSVKGEDVGTSFSLGAAAPFTTPGKYYVTVEAMVVAETDVEDPAYDYHGGFTTTFMVVVE